MRHARYESRSLSRGLNVLECLRGYRRPMRLKEVASFTGLPSATTYRLLSALVELGYVNRTDHSFSLGYLSGRFAEAVDRTRLIAEIALPVLASLAHATGTCAQLAEVRNGVVVLLEEIDASPRQSAAHGIDAASAINQLLLANKSGGGHTQVPLIEKRRMGSGLMSYAVPITDQADHFAGALGLIGSEYRLIGTTNDMVIKQLKKGAQEILDRMIGSESRSLSVGAYPAGSMKKLLFAGTN